MNSKKTLKVKPTLKTKGKNISRNAPAEKHCSPVMEFNTEMQRLFIHMMRVHEVPVNQLAEWTFLIIVELLKGGVRIKYFEDFMPFIDKVPKPLLDKMKKQVSKYQEEVIKKYALKKKS